jgi:hypothetical protein
VNDCRILSLDEAVSGQGQGWHVVCASDPFRPDADVALVSAASDITDSQIDRLALPLIVRVVDDAAPQARWLDRADALLLPGDDPAVLGLLAQRLAHGVPAGVAEQSLTAQHIAALSQEAQRIADTLAQLALAADSDAETPVNAQLVRRLIKLRRDRDRHLPAELFGDPAWDMLLDLTAAHMEQVDVPVSSLCLAAAVPTTTALRWVRSLSEAGIFVRRTDPGDARRSFIGLSDQAQGAMTGWLRRFAGQFQLR